jgi:hypothetical protein
VHHLIGKFHFSCHVHILLDREFPEHWQGREGLISRPTCSPDLTPLDFFFWRLVKDSVHCKKKWQNASELHHRIIRVADHVINEMLANIRQETEYCFDVCHATNGAHTEIY